MFVSILARTLNIIITALLEEYNGQYVNVARVENFNKVFNIWKIYFYGRKFTIEFCAFRSNKDKNIYFFCCSEFDPISSRNYRKAPLSCRNLCKRYKVGLWRLPVVNIHLPEKQLAENKTGIFVVCKVA